MSNKFCWAILKLDTFEFKSRKSLEENAKGRFDEKIRMIAQLMAEILNFSTLLKRGKQVIEVSKF